MERAEILSEILRDQIRNGAPRESLLWTLGMIRTEILAMPPGPGYTSEAIPEKPAEGIAVDTAAQSMRSEVPGGGTHASEAVRPMPSESQRDLASQDPPPAAEDSVSPETTAVTPTHRAPTVEINQRVADGAASLNDRLRQGAPELAERLVPEAVTDLRRAFGINDRFRLINELFKGDDAAFDDAVLHLNCMPGLSQAMGYIDRELMVRRGWDAADPLVEQLRQSVRRRFSSI